MFPNTRPNFDLKNHKDILQLKIFIMSYVNTCSQEQGNTSLFDFLPSKKELMLTRPMAAKHSNSFH